MKRTIRIPSRSNRAFIAAVAGIGVAVWLGWGWRVSHPSAPHFSTAERRSGYDVRVYDSMLAAQTLAAGTRADAVAEAARILKPYFGGTNVATAAIADVAELTGERITIVTGLTSQEHADGWLIAAPLPGRYDALSAPRPEDPRIRIVELKTGRVAVRSFAGGLDQADEQEQLLMELLVRDRMIVTGRTSVVLFDAQGLPPFFRRTEILIPVY